MDGEIKKLLEKNLAVAQESLKILKKINRARKVSAFFKLLYWFLILGIIIGGYVYLKPYLIQLQEIYQKLPQTLPF